MLRSLAARARWCCWIVIALGAATTAAADVVVIANRTPRFVKFEVLIPSRPELKFALDPGDLAPVFVAGPVGVRFTSGDKPASFRLEPNSAYFFHQRAEDGPVELEKIGLIDPPGVVRPPVEDAAPAAVTAPDQNALVTWPVKLLVDEEEAGVPAVWEDRLRKRLARASAVLEKYCRLRLEVVEVEVWDSDDALTDFGQTLREFERKVPTDPARLAIGFTSQYQLPQGRTNLGGTSGPLSTHILLREWSRHVSESERLELLIHELGHFAGSGHSPERASVMRPVLGDGQANARKFRLTFDPLNTLAMCRLTGELRERDIRQFSQVAPAAKADLLAIYATLAKAQPDDPAANRLMALLGSEGVAPPRKPLPRSATPLAIATRDVLDAAVAAASPSRTMSLEREPVDEPAAAVDPQNSDAQFEAAVRAAAKRARSLPAEHARQAFLLGLGIAVDNTDLLRGNAVVRGFLKSIETDEDRAQRLKTQPAFSIQGRTDLAQHFAVSAALCGLAGPTLAESAGLLKELKDSQGGSGFSFADLAVDLAGIAYAEHLGKQADAWVDVAERFQTDAYVPSVAGLPEGLQQADFLSQYGGTSDPRFLARSDELRKQIQALTGYGGAAETDAPATPVEEVPRVED